MKPNLDPFTVLLNFESGEFDPPTEVVERRLSDMAGLFQEDPPTPDVLVYRILPVPVPRTNSELMSSTTIMEAGKVGDEFFMTKGHFHAIRDRSEIYIGLSGEGLLIMATEAGETRVEPMHEGTINYIPGGWAHRSVNTGDEPLIFYAAYIGDAGYDYETIEKEGFPVIVVDGADGPSVVENPRYRKQR